MDQHSTPKLYVPPRCIKQTKSFSIRDVLVVENIMLDTEDDYSKNLGCIDDINDEIPSLVGTIFNEMLAFFSDSHRFELSNYNVLVICRNRCGFSREYNPARNQWEIRFNLATQSNTYLIKCVIRPENRQTGDAYLGCSANSRKVRPGEDWVRGNDLPDGKYSQELLDEILHSIFSYELVSHRSDKWKERLCCGPLGRYSW